MKNYLVWIMLLFVLSLNLSSAIGSIQGPVKVNTCPGIIQTCKSCSFNNVTLIQYPGPNSSIALQGQYAMTNLGAGNFQYPYCFTQLGTYVINGHGDINGADTDWGTFTIEVNGSGQTITQHQITLLIIGLVVMMVVILFFFTLGYLFKHPGTKIFFMSLATLTLVALIAIITSNASVYLAEFSSLASFYNAYYLIIISLTGAAMAGLVVWLIYYAFTLFSKSRGTFNEGVGDD